MTDPTTSDAAAAADTTPTPDPVEARLAELRAQKAARAAAASDPRLAEIAALEAELADAPAAPAAGAAWADVPPLAGADPSTLSPEVREILAQLAATQAELAKLKAKGAPSNDVAPPPDAWIGLACGDSVKVASSIPTEHYCDNHKATVKVVTGYLARTDGEPE